MNEENKQNDVLFTIECLENHKTNFDYCLEQLIKETKKLNNIINNIKKELELFNQSDFNTNNCITFINKIEKELKK